MPELREALNGHDVRKAHTNSRGSVVITQPTVRWPFLRPPGERAAEERAERPGARMIQWATAFLFVLGLGLLAVSVAAQYRWVLSERHQHVASVIEAVALDVGMVIFSLLALGLARAGLAAKAERGLVVVCAAGSALMNLAAADVASPRSVLAFVMPPIFLAIVVDRTVTTTRRHVLGMRAGRSPWAVLGRVTLYALRFALAPWPTAKGLRRLVLAAAPLPAVAIPGPKALAGGTVRPSGLPRRSRPERGGTKTARLLALAEERHGPLAGIPLSDVSRVATALAPDADLHPGSARSALLNAVRAAQAGEPA
jgi:hypothetical protein